MSGLSLLVLLWFLPSFLLHNLIHEGAHALVALWGGARNVTIWPFPGWRAGRFTWAHVTWTYATPQLIAPTALLYTAPLLAEAAWAAVAMNGALALGGWVAHLLLIEATCALVDATVWLLGYWNPVPNPLCDAERARTIMGFSRTEGKLKSLLLLPLWAGLVLATAKVLGPW